MFKCLEVGERMACLETRKKIPVVIRFKEFGVLAVWIRISLFSQLTLTELSYKHGPSLGSHVHLGWSEELMTSVSEGGFTDTVLTKEELAGGSGSRTQNERRRKGRWRILTWACPSDSHLERTAPAEAKKWFIKRTQVWVPKTHAGICREMTAGTRAKATWLPHLWDIHEQTSQQGILLSSSPFIFWQIK